VQIGNEKAAFRGECWRFPHERHAIGNDAAITRLQQPASNLDLLAGVAFKGSRRTLAAGSGHRLTTLSANHLEAEPDRID